jgi:hypothetical protein
LTLILEKEKHLEQLFPLYQTFFTRKTAPEKPLSVRDKIYLFRKTVAENLVKFRPGKALEDLQALNEKFKKHHYYYIEQD